MLTVEYEPAVSDTCSCCDTPSTRLTRFVSRDGDAYAVYYAAFSEQHPRPYVEALVGIGDWAEDAPASARCSFYLRIRSTPDQFEVTVCDGTDSPWGDVTVLGHTLRRDEALAHPRIQEIFAITDHIVMEDTPIVDYLSHAPQSA
jgi:hypothetical protein